MSGTMHTVCQLQDSSQSATFLKHGRCTKTFMPSLSHKCKGQNYPAILVRSFLKNLSHQHDTGEKCQHKVWDLVVTKTMEKINCNKTNNENKSIYDSYKEDTWLTQPPWSHHLFHLAILCLNCGNHFKTNFSWFLIDFESNLFES